MEEKTVAYNPRPTAGLILFDVVCHIASVTQKAPTTLLCIDTHDEDAGLGQGKLVLHMVYKQKRAVNLLEGQVHIVLDELDDFYCASRFVPTYLTPN